MVFNLSGEEFAIGISKVNSIVKIDAITRIPNSENHIEGVLNLRGKIIVVTNLCRKLGLSEKKQDQDTRIIVVEIGNESVGAIVDSVNEVIRIPEDDIKQAPKAILERIQPSFIKGVGLLDQRLIILLNVEQVLAKKDSERNRHPEEAVKQELQEASEFKGVKETLKEINKEKERKAKKPEEAPEDQYFWFHHGTTVKNVSELVSEIEKIDENAFNQHVNPEKNDFAAWIRHVLKDEELAGSIETGKSKEETIKILKTEKNRWRF